jgi:mannose-6-phosphate isomerase
MVTKRRAPRPAVPTVRRLEGVGVAAEWGAPELLAAFTDRPAEPLDGPEAEVWFGAHPRHPSWVLDERGRRPASQLDASEQPPLIVKLLAAAAPLSVQVHPDDAAAQRGFAAEEGAGVTVDAPERLYLDASGKPELLRAIGPMRVLCGFRSAGASRALLSMVAPEGADVLLEALAHGDSGIGAAVATVLRADAVTAAVLLAAVRDGALELVSRASASDAGARAPVDEQALRLARLALDLQRRYPEDRATIIALLLEDVDLAPGEAIAVAPGTPHAYLSGLGVEVMAPSDNVLRAGMTVKHVDVEAFLEVLDPAAVGAPRVGSLPRRAEGTGWQRIITPSDAYVVDEAHVDGALRVERDGSSPAVVLCLSGEVVVRAQDGSRVELGAGGAALLDANIVPVELRGQADVIHATRFTRGTADLTSA